MHWLFLAAAVLAVGFIQLGAMSVWVLVLSVALKTVLLIAGILAAGVGVTYLLRRYKESRER